MRTISRSLRLESDLDNQMKSLPPGTGNDLVNQLLRLFFNNSLVREMVILKDGRYANSVTAPLENPDPPVPTDPLPTSVLDEILPK